MKEYFKIDENGNILDVTLLDESQEIPENHVLGWGQDRSFYKAIYNFDADDWIEGLTQEEIDEINNKPKELTETEKLKLSLAETYEKSVTDNIENKLAIADLIETLTMKGVL